MLRANQSVPFLSLLAVLLLGVGCSTAQKTIPHMGVGQLSMEANIERKDLVVTRSVEGRSSVTSVLFGLIQIIDGNKVKLAGIPFFTDKFTYFRDSGSFFISPEDRAYYKALEKSPDADIVFVKSMDREQRGIPIIWSTQEVTFRGKALRLRSDE